MSLKSHRNVGGRKKKKINELIIMGFKKKEEVKLDEGQKKGRGRPRLPDPHEQWKYVFADNSRVEGTHGSIKSHFRCW